jgi:hypothetical protein
MIPYMLHTPPAHPETACMPSLCHVHTQQNPLHLLTMHCPHLSVSSAATCSRDMMRCSTPMLGGRLLRRFSTRLTTSRPGGGGDTRTQQHGRPVSRCKEGSRYWMVVSLGSLLAAKLLSLRNPAETQSAAPLRPQAHMKPWCRESHNIPPLTPPMDPLVGGC